MKKSNENKYFLDAARLFLIDIDVQPSLRSYEEYENAEPGYSSAMLKAYKEAFLLPVDKDLIKKIHRIAVSHLPVAGGEVKFENNHTFPLGFSEMIFSSGAPEKTAGSTASMDGLHQLITTWFTPETSIHLLVIGEDPEKQILIFPYNPITKAQGIWVYDVEKSSMVPYTRQILDSYKHRLIKHNDRAQVCVGNPTYSRGIDPVSFCNSKLESLYKEFKNNISKAQNDDEKIEAIATYIQSIDQLHPFQDGNIRACYILLNRLLHEYDLPFTLLINPNRIDSYTTKELVDIIKNGQKFFAKMFKERTSSYEPYLPVFHLENSPIKAEKDVILSFNKIITQNLNKNIFLTEKSSELITQFSENDPSFFEKNLQSKRGFIAEGLFYDISREEYFTLKNKKENAEDLEISKTYWNENCQPF